MVISRAEYRLEALAYLDCLWVELLDKALKSPPVCSEVLGVFSLTFKTLKYLGADLTLEAAVHTCILEVGLEVKARKVLAVVSSCRRLDARAREWVLERQVELSNNQIFVVFAVPKLL